ncbi:MAG: phosphoribosylanthranilate isomerase [Burkholderiales bacterium]|nr:phosphoribosylanthranilate isomerase [Burkholderiales bacterium]
MPVAVKICGITRVEDALAAAHAGAHALGFIFHPPSPRNIDVPRAQAIVRALPPFITTVGVFVDPDRAIVEAVIKEIRLGVLQFHGDEDPVFCARFGMPYMKAVRVRRDLDLLQYTSVFRAAQALLLDAFVPGSHGGTGQTFDWSLIPPALPVPVVLSGGLDAANVATAIRRVRPWAVDVSSGVEIDKGIKDAAKIAAFMRGVRDADV